jgi:hypothetical protein
MSELKAAFRLTRKEVEILKEALDSHLDGFSPDDNEQAWEDASALRDFIIFEIEKLKDAEVNSPVPYEYSSLDDIPF